MSPAARAVSVEPLARRMCIGESTVPMPPSADSRISDLPKIEVAPAVTGEAIRLPLVLMRISPSGVDTRPIGSVPSEPR